MFQGSGSSASAASTGLVNPETTHKGLCEDYWTVAAKLKAHRRFNRMRRGVTTAANLIEEMNAGGRYRALFVTLTYRPDAQPRQKQCREFLNHVRMWARARRASVRYVWTLELTKAGRPHYHLVIWVPVSLRMPRPDSSGWWPWGMSQVQVARNAVGYLISYIKKARADDLPRGWRIFGCGGLTDLERRTKRYRLLPRYVRDAFTFDDAPQRAKGGGWVSTTSGLWLPAVLLWFIEGAYWIETADGVRQRLSLC